MAHRRSGVVEDTTERMHRLILVISLGLALTLQTGLASDQKLGPPASAQEVTGGLRLYDEVLPARSPDGRWLAFEYSDISDPNDPQIGIMRVGQDPHSWHPLLKGEPGTHLFVGDLSWSPDSRWLAVITDYPKGTKAWSGSKTQVVKVNIHSHEVVRLTSFPPGTSLGATTAWLRSGLIVFSGADENIYGVSESSGKVQKVLDVPTDKCSGGTNTLSVSPDEQKIAFAMDKGGASQTTECNALWIGDLRTGDLRRVPTTGLSPLSSSWLDGNTILFSGVIDAETFLPVGIYSVSLSTGNVTRLLKGPYMTPSICDSGKTLYFSWRSRLRTKTPVRNDWSIRNEFHQFHIWKVSLHDVLPAD
jgi:WD40-like Beta Propeller Repeat